jgi:hypothetical protein
MLRLLELPHYVSPDLRFVMDDAKLLLENHWRSHTHAVTDRVAVIDPLQQPGLGRQLASIRAEYAIDAVLPRTVAKHRRRREWIQIAKHDRHNNIRRQEHGGRR